eukprot:TRINITY_DN15261_c0_g3_i2.p1 TRINITY_DN15261_c0_g3~~TRINITY_DN15261_c0_g3_i2.p1  ORF type:complete len:404 (-),score=28.71 TRINITY_DN15261_c0_g3_i2:229-1440(-)
MGKALVKNLLWSRFGKLMHWWNGLVGAEETWLGSLLLYMTFADLGQQVVHVGFDKELVAEGRKFAEDNDGTPDQTMEARFEQMSDHLRKTSPKLGRSFRRIRRMIESSGVTCIHFEPPAGLSKFKVNEYCRHKLQGRHQCQRKVHLPLGRKLFLYSGQTTLWPDDRLGTLSGVAFLEVASHPTLPWRHQLSVFVSIGTFASMPFDMFMNKVFELKPVFYVGTLDHADPRQRLADMGDCRKNPIDEHGWLKKQIMHASANLVSEVLRRPPARPVINRTRQCNPCHGLSQADFYSKMMNMTVLHHFANKRARGEDPLEDAIGRDGLATVMRTLQGTFACSGSYLWTPGVDQQMTFGDCLAWVHFMLETPETPETTWMVDGQEADGLRSTNEDAFSRTWIPGARCK